MSPRHILLGVLVAIVWGTNFVAIGIGLLDTPPLVLVALRFVLVALPLVFFIKRPEASWWTIAGVGLFMSAGQFGLVYLAMGLGLPVGLAAVILQCQAAFTMLIAFVALGERPSRLQIAGAAVALLGLGIVAAGRLDGAAELGVVVPVLICAAGGLSWAIGNVIARSAPKADGFGMVVWSALFVPVPVLLLSLGVDGPAVVADAFTSIGWQTVGSVAFTVVFASLFGYTVWN
ncbi:MAG: EamA family transporter, partial [Microbacteriaceae bacterium]|nr:EamA family transporter [Microbacteriaceae bacterium]